MPTMGAKAPDIRRSSSRQHLTNQTRHCAAAGWRRLGALAIALALCLVGHGTAAQDRDADCEGVACLARSVIDTIPEGETIALIPFWWPVTDLPNRQAEVLYKDIYQAMSHASGDRHGLVKRDRDYDRIWEATKWEVAQSNYQEYVDRLRATVVVHCKDQGLIRGMIKFSCTATGVGKGSALARNMPQSQGLIPVPGERQLFPYEYALTQLSNTLADGARKQGSGPQRIPVISIVDTDIGQRSELTEDIGRRLLEGIAMRFETFRQEQQSHDSFTKAIGRQSGDAAETPDGYELHGKLVWMDEARERATLWMELREGRRLIAQDRAELERGWLPRMTAGARRYTAEARATPSDTLHEEIASAAATNLARARIVAKAVGIPAPEINIVTAESEGVEALEFLAHGIPVDEQFNTWTDAAGESHVSLKARVVAVGSRMRPDVEAVLTKSALKAKEKYAITLSAAAAVHVGVFAWGADDRVVRFYPNEKVRNLIVPAGGRVSLPRKKDKSSFSSAPLPGHTENHEAVIVVASSNPLDLGKLGAMAGKTAIETMKVAIPTGRFLNALGELDMSHATLLVLPYRVWR